MCKSNANPSRPARSVPANPIYLVAANDILLQAALDRVQTPDLGVHYLLTPDKLRAFAVRAEQQLNQWGLSDTQRVGARFTYCPSGPAKKWMSNGYWVTSTVLVRFRAGWALQRIARKKVWPKEKLVWEVACSRDQVDRLAQSILKTAQARVKALQRNIPTYAPAAKRQRPVGTAVTTSVPDLAAPKPVTVPDDRLSPVLPGDHLDSEDAWV